MNSALVYPHLFAPAGYPRDFARLFRELTELGVSVESIAYPKERAGGLACAARLLREVTSAANTAELVHFVGVFVPEYLLAARVLRAKGIPYVVSPLSHLQPLARDRQAMKKSLFLRLGGIGFLKAATAVHSFGASETESVLGVGFRGDVFELPLGLYTEDVAAAGHEGAGHQPTDVPDPFVLFFGRLDTFQKGLDLLLDGFELYADACPDGLGLVIAGRSWEGSGDWLKARIAASPAKNRVHFLGETSDPVKFELMRRARAVIYPSRFDGPPRPLRDAIALGTFVLASRQSNICPGLERDGLGRFFDANRVGVAEALERFGSQPMRSMRPEKAHLAWPEVGKEYLKMYEHVAQSR